jgi:predicted metal-dependent enzyme (double-stranded beta helix superfamily)
MRLVERGTGVNILSGRFQKFIRNFTQLIDTAGGDESLLIPRGKVILSQLVAADDWLPDRYAQPHPQYYQQYLLHADPSDRFSVVSFVWGPGQKTPIHNHTVWGLIGMLRGGEHAENFCLGAEGRPMQACGAQQLRPGVVESVSPITGDSHRVSNLFEDRVSISIHVYGGNIGRVCRDVFDPQSGTRKPFVSGYSNEGEVCTTSAAPLRVL